MLLFTRMQRFCIPPLGWTSPTMCAGCCGMVALRWLCSWGDLLWKSSITGQTLPSKFGNRGAMSGAVYVYAWFHEERWLHILGNFRARGAAAPFANWWTSPSRMPGQPLRLLPVSWRHHGTGILWAMEVMAVWAPFMEGTSNRTHIRIVCANSAILKPGTALRPCLVPWGRAGYACKPFHQSSPWRMP